MLKRSIRCVVAFVATACAAPWCAAGVQTMTYGPTPYLSELDSPFAALPNFALENFESGALTLTGVTMSAGAFIEPPSTFTDSVDGDDGVIDGFGRGGRSCVICPGTTGILFTFDAVAIGFAPTYAGMVFTDGSFNALITFRAFDTDGVLIATITGNHADNSFAGETGEDRFYGVYHSAGIGSIFMMHAGVNCLEVDHVQYAFVPTPGSAALMAVAFLLVRRRRVA